MAESSLELEKQKSLTDTEDEEVDSAPEACFALIIDRGQSIDFVFAELLRLPGKAFNGS